MLGKTGIFLTFKLCTYPPPPNNSKFALITKTTYVSFGWPLLLGFQITDLFLPEDISHIRCCVPDIYARNLQAAVGTRREGLRRDTHVGGPSGYQGISSK